MCDKQCKSQEQRGQLPWRTGEGAFGELVFDRNGYIMCQCFGFGSFNAHDTAELVVAQVNNNYCNPGPKMCLDPDCGCSQLPLVRRGQGAYAHDYTPSSISLQDRTEAEKYVCPGRS